MNEKIVERANYFLESIYSREVFKSQHGSIKYHFFDSSDVDTIEEYQPSLKNPIWTQTDKWVSLDYIQVDEYSKGHGTTLFNSWKDTLPPNTLILLNASPDDGIGMNQSDLVKWYKKMGFQDIEQSNNPSLYLVT